EYEIVKLLSQVTKRGKAVAVWMISMFGGSNGLTRQLEANRIPVYPSAERAVRALGALYKYNVLRGRE
ncbi:unnamed protein product, partial [marine sediment metagenome]